MHWSNKYLGTPYQKMNCAQLVADRLRDVGLTGLASDLEGYEEHDQSIRAQAKALRGGVPIYGEERKTPEDGLIAYFKEGLPHVGLICEIMGKFYVLHSSKKSGQVVREPFDRVGPLALYWVKE